MSEHPAIATKCLFHESLTWNLFEDSIEARFVDPPPGGSVWAAMRAKGISQGWLNPTMRRKAREMFVYSERMLLPYKGATPARASSGEWLPATLEPVRQISQLQRHLGWVDESELDKIRVDSMEFGESEPGWNKAWSLTASSQADLVRNLWPFIRTTMNAHGHEFDASQWRTKVRLWSARVASGEVDWSAVKNVIEDANAYIEGAEWLSTVVPSWSVFITLPLALVTPLAPALAPLSWISIGASSLCSTCAVGFAAEDEYGKS